MVNPRRQMYELWLASKGCAMCGAKATKLVYAGGLPAPACNKCYERNSSVGLWFKAGVNKLAEYMGYKAEHVDLDDLPSLHVQIARGITRAVRPNKPPYKWMKVETWCKLLGRASELAEELRKEVANGEHLGRVS